MDEINRFLDNLDETRNARTVESDRRGMLWQCDGYRHEWALYLDEYNDNLYNS